jgi:hypothetical protein
MNEELAQRVDEAFEAAEKSVDVISSRNDRRDVLIAKLKEFRAYGEVLACGDEDLIHAVDIRVESFIAGRTFGA